MTLLAAISTVFLGGAALTNGADVVCSAALAVDETTKAGEIGFATDWPADVHWFGAYLRKGEDRYSIHPEPFVAGSYFAPEKPLGDGLDRFKFIVKPGFTGEGFAQVRFRARHAANPPRPDAAAISALGKKPHPRLMLKSGDDVFARIKGATATNELLAAAVRHMKVFSDKLLDEPPVEYRLDGRRLWSQHCTARTFGLAQMYKISGDRRYLDRLERELRDVAAYPDWNPPHFIDTALFAFDFAIAYDWLYDDWSPEMLDVLAKAMVDKALKAADPNAFWIHNGNNWSQVCLCGMLAASIAIAEREPELARRHIGDAVSFLHEPVEAYAPVGAFPEGVGYWDLATTYQVYAIESLRSAFGTDFGLVGEPGFLASGEFPDLMMGPSGQLFNHSDSGRGRGLLAPLWWYARELGRPDLVTTERKIGFANYAHAPAMNRNPHSCEFCFIPLIWMVDVPTGSTASKTPLSWWSGSSVPITVQTASRDDPDAIWVAMKGGTAQASHAHADQGSFVLDALGERWAEDLGGESYGIGEAEHGMKFWDSSNESPRWSYFRLGPQGHNLVTIEGEKPNVGGFAALNFCRSTKRKRDAICHLSAIHPSASSAKRTGSLAKDGKRYVIRDAFSGVKPGTVLVWRMNTYAKPKIDGRAVVLEKNGKRLRLEASAGEWSTFVPELPKSNPDPNLVQLQLRVTADESGDAAWSVTFIPVGKDSSK